MPASPPIRTRTPSFRLPAALLAAILPSAYFFLRVHQDDLGALVRAYILTGILGIPFSMLIQTILSYLIALLCFRNNTTVTEYLTESIKQPDLSDQTRTKLRRKMSRNPRYWLFILLFCFLGPGMIEEGVKYLAIMLAVSRQAHRKDGELDVTPAEKLYVYISAACVVGLAFAMFENAAFFISAALSARKREEQSNPAKRETQPQPGENPLSTLTILERVLVAAPGHTMTAALIGMNMLSRDARPGFPPAIGLWPILRDPILFHGCWDFGLLAVSAWEGNVGWAHPRKTVAIVTALGFVVGLQVILADVLWGRLRQY